MAVIKLTVVYNFDILCCTGPLINVKNIACPLLSFVCCAWGDRLDRLLYDKPNAGSDSQLHDKPM